MTSPSIDSARQKTAVTKPPFDKHAIIRDPDRQRKAASTMPMVDLGDTHIGKGWERAPQGEVIKTYWQYYAYWTTPPSWGIGSFCTSDGEINRGFQTYRRPASLRAWLTIAVPAIKKLIHRRWGKD